MDKEEIKRQFAFLENSLKSLRRQLKKKEKLIAILEKLIREPKCICPQSPPCGFLDKNEMCGYGKI